MPSRYANYSNEQLQQLKTELENNIASLDGRQQAIKIGINSAYGATANVYFRLYHPVMAASITLLGQVAIKFVARRVNEYLNGKMKTENYDFVVASDTDSVVGDSILIVNGQPTKISDLFDSQNEYIKNDDFNNNYVKIIKGNILTPSVSPSGELENKKILYVMKHKVNKMMYRITDNNGNSVVVTEDHSVIVKDIKTNNILSIKPKNIDKSRHQILTISDTDSGVIEDENAKKTNTERVI